MRYLTHSIGFRWLHQHRDGVGSVILMVTLRRVAVELLGLFSPLYIFSLVRDLDCSVQNSVLVVIGYFLLIYVTKLLTMPLAENASFKIGYRRTLVLSIIPFFLFVGFLSLSQAFPFLLFLVTIFWGVHAALFWFGYHGLFVKRADQEHFGKQTGACQALYILMGILTPIGGGLIILQFGYQVLFLIAGAIFTLAVMIALLSGEIKPQRDARINNVFQLFKTHKRAMVSYFGWGFESALYSSIWPIFLFILVGRILAFGEIIAAAVLVAAVLTYLIGLVVDRIGTKKVISLGSTVGFLSFLGRAVVRTPLAIVGVDGFYRVSEQMLHISLLVKSYKKAIDGGTGQALYFMEISLGLGAITGLFLTGVLVALNLPLGGIFLLASLGALAPILLARR